MVIIGTVQSFGNTNLMRCSKGKLAGKLQRYSTPLPAEERAIRKAEEAFEKCREMFLTQLEASAQHPKVKKRLVKICHDMLTCHTPHHPRRENGKAWGKGGHLPIPPLT